MLGATLSIIANRISYYFDLRGPSMAIDTACSSTLVALHEAVQTLQSGRSKMAILGASNVLLSPAAFVGFSKARMLSPEGKCRAFGKGGEGYVRAEGGGVLILKPLKEAQRDGDPILALIRGVDINTDGRTAGMALPSTDAQRSLLQDVYGQSKIPVDAVSYFEAHGTGTAVGDRAEATAIGKAIGKRRPKSDPLWIGSVKSNIGHLEPAAGMAGLIKSIEILRHGVIPPSLHSSELNPGIDFSDLNLRVVQETMALPAIHGRKLIGINSFGFGGTNGHAILEDYGTPHSKRNSEDISLPLTISARTEAALEQQVTAFAASLKHFDPLDWYDFAYTAACKRTHYEFRHVLRAKNAREAATLLEASLGTAHSRGPASRNSKTALVFTGNGAQWIGMGRKLLDEDKDFRQAFEQIDASAHWRLGWSLTQTIQSPHAPLEDTRTAQPLIFALQVALVRALEAKGLTFQGVVGHSVGELAAAHIAGALTLEQAIHVVKERSEAQASTYDRGRMMVAGIGAAGARDEISDLGRDVEIAAINSPRSVTLSGTTEAISALEKRFKRKRIAAKLLDIKYAYHSHQQDSVRDPLLAGLGKIEAKNSEVTFYSTVTGTELPGFELGEEYWWHNVREVVRFSDAISAMEADGYRTFVEIGPSSQLLGNLRHILKSGRPIGTLTRENDGLAAILKAVDEAHIAGARLDFNKIFAQRGKVMTLPVYPWQRENYWHQATVEAKNGVTARLDAPLLGVRVASNSQVWENILDVDTMPFLRGHQVGKNYVFPAAGFIEIVLEAGLLLFGDVPLEIENLEIFKPLLLDTPRAIRTSIGDGGYFRIEAREYMRSSIWSVYATGRLASAAAMPASPTADISSQAVTVKGDAHYAFTQKRGFGYSGEFQALNSVTADVHSATGQVDPLDTPLDYRLHIGLLDAVLQTVFPILQLRTENSTATNAYLPHKFGHVYFGARAEAPAETHIELKHVSTRAIVADGVLREATGAAIVVLQDIRLSAVDLWGDQKPNITFYTQTLEPLPPISPTPVPLEAAQAAINQLSRETASSGSASLLDELAAAFAAETLLELGQTTPTNLPLLSRVIDAAQSYVSEERSAGERWRANLALRPELISEINYVGRFARSLAKQLAGDSEPADFENARQRLIENGAVAKNGCSSLSLAFEKFVQNWPDERRLRVLQIGSGSEGFSQDLCERMPDGMGELAIVEQDNDRRQSLIRDFENKADVSVLDRIGPDGSPLFDLVVVAYSKLPDDIHHLLSPGALLLQAQIAPSPWASLVLATLSTSIGHEWSSQARIVADGVELSCGRTPAVSMAMDLIATNDWTIIVAPGDIQMGDDLAATLVAYGHKATVKELEYGGNPFDGANVIFAYGLLGSHGVSQELERCEALLRFLTDNKVSTLVVPVRDALSGYMKGPPKPERAGIAGIVRVLQNERPNILCRTIDLRCLDDVIVNRLAEEITHGAEAEVVLSDMGRFAPRLNAARADEVQHPEDQKLVLQSAGNSLDQLRWTSEPRTKVGANEVEISVKAIGLNFRDVMFAMGLLPPEILESGFAGATLGMEAAGVVTKVGAAESEMKIGDKVICFAPSSLSNYIVTRSEAVVPLPQGLTYAEGATLTTAFFTVTYALARLAKLVRGERILIHGAAGGVGIAALQYARSVGAEIFATVGSDDKRDFLRLMGIPDSHIFSSRTLEFASQIREITHGEGVDVVLNSLASEAVYRGLSILRPFGRFIELGKVDFVSNSKVGLSYFRNNIAYFGVDADQLMSVLPATAKSILMEVQELTEKAVFWPLPYSEFSWKRAPQAFRHMQRARHIGKIVVTAPEAGCGKTILHNAVSIDPAGTYIVTGGLKGFGLASAQWLAKKGAKHLVLVGRGAIPDESSARAIESLREAGAHIDLRACDVRDEFAVKLLIDEFRSTLKGIIHAATVYDDAAIGSITAKSFEAVVEAKAVGALLLDRATRDIKLDLFVLYSSISSVIGNPGQASYVAANMILESLADRRKSEGLAAQIAALPPLSDVGHLTGKASLSELFTKIGVRPIDSETVFSCLDEIVLKGKNAFLIADVNWGKLKTALPFVGTQKFKKLTAADNREDGASSDLDFIALAATLTAGELAEVLVENMSQAVGQILHVPAEKLDRDCSVFDLGMDSLMGLELRMSIEKRFGVSLPALALSQDLSIRRAAEMVQKELLGSEPDTRAQNELTAESERSFILTRHGENISENTIADVMHNVRHDMTKRLIT